MIKVIELLKTTLNVDVYSGEIPESQTNPALLLQDLAHNYKRTTTGRKVKKSSNWRITVVAAMQSDVESILDKLEDMDNTRNQDFQRIFTNLVMREVGLNEQPYRRAFYDLTVY